MVMRVVIAMLAAGIAGPAAAQERAPLAAIVAGADQSRERFQIAAMESVLERAVQLGARRLSQQVQSISPDALVIAGAARARGFQLEGYGVFFDVDVPALRRSVAWSFRQLGRTEGGIEATMTSLRQSLGQVNDPALRREMEAHVQRLARLVGPVPLPPGAIAPVPGQPQTVTASAAGAQPSQSPGLSAQQAALLDDPGLAYTNEVKAALVDVMLDYGTPIPIAENEWLTVAARDDNSRLGGADSYDNSTVMLRIRGADLSAFRSGTLSRADAIARVEVREY
jgi:hypothetical protein